MTRKSALEAEPAGGVVRDPEFEPLTAFLKKVPSISGAIGVGAGNGDIAWWVKFTIDVSDPLAWRAVQELPMCSTTSRSTSGFRPCSCRYPHPHI